MACLLYLWIVAGGVVLAYCKGWADCRAVDWCECHRQAMREGAPEDWGALRVEIPE